MNIFDHVYLNHLKRKISMKKIISKFIVTLIIFYPIICFSQQNLANFKTVANQSNFPAICVKLDSLLKNMYEATEQSVYFPTYLKEMDERILLEYAKTLTAFYQLPKYLEYKYLNVANAPFDEVSQRICDNRNNDTEADIPTQYKPGSVLRNIKKAIFKRLSWDWKFHIMNRYILAVRVINAEIRPNSRCTSSSAPFYSCEILRDIKGNYKGPQQVEFIGNYIKGNMEAGNEYLVLVWGECVVEDTRTGLYGLRGLATDSEAIFPIIDNKIRDKNNTLRTGMTEISLDYYQSIIRYFLISTAGVQDEN